MANTLISGAIGSGKTYLTVKEFILPALKLGRKVYTNIDLGDEKGLDFLGPCRFSLYLKKDVRELLICKPFDQLKELLILNDFDGETLRVSKNSVIIIDEAQMIFDYLSVNTVDKRIYHLFAYARHFGLDLVFITQSPDLLNKFIIKLCNQFLTVQGHKQATILAKNVYQVDYRNTCEGILLQRRVRTYDTDIFKLFRSYVATSEDIFRQYLPAGFWKVAIPLLAVAVLAIFSLHNIGAGKGFFVPHI